MNTHRRHLAAALIAGVALAACGTSPPARYYALTAASADEIADSVDGVAVLGIGPIRMPEYLERPQMVTRLENNEMAVDDFNRWAEPVADAMPSILALSVDGLMTDAMAIAYPGGGLADYDFRLVGRVHRFDMDALGNTVLSVHWTIRDAAGKVAVPPTRSRFVSDGGNPADPGSVARHMSACLDDFSREIAARFTVAGAADAAD